jgi:hypothetical protein
MSGGGKSGHAERADAATGYGRGSHLPVEISDAGFAKAFDTLLERTGLVPALTDVIAEADVSDQSDDVTPTDAYDALNTGSVMRAGEQLDAVTTAGLTGPPGTDRRDPTTEANDATAGSSDESCSASHGEPDKNRDGDVGDAACADDVADLEDAQPNQRRRDEALWRAASMRAELTPFAAGILSDLESQLTAEGRALLSGPRRLVHLREPANMGEHIEAISTALEALLQAVALPQPDDVGSPWIDVTVGRGAKSTGQTRMLAELASAFSRHRVVAVCERDDAPADLERLADITLRVRPLDVASLTVALQHGLAPAVLDLGDDDAQLAASRDLAATEREAVLHKVAAMVESLGARFDLSLLDPALVDLACGKASNIEEAGVLLARGLTSRTQEASASSASEGPTLEALPGYGSVRPWATALVDDLRKYALGELSWADVDPGALLVGPPGTGKTMLAGAIARSANCRFVPTSFATWQSVDGGHLGSVIAAMRKSFAEALVQTPTLLFIDEIDALPSRGASKHHDDYWRAIVNGVLEELDGSRRREGLLVLAACNDASGIDPAILRSGRLDRVVEVGMPTAADLAAILRHLMPEFGVEAERLSALLAGSTTGADIVRMNREARQRARREGRDVSVADLMAIAMPPDARSAPVRRRVALHEAGHAVAFVLAGRMPETISIQPSGPERAGGWLAVARPYGGQGRLHEYQRSELLPLLAGRAAEEMILGEASGGAGGAPASDLARATDLSATLVGRLGLGSSLRYGNAADAREVEDTLRRVYAEAQMLVLVHRGSIERLADALLVTPVMTRTDIEAFTRTEGLARDRADPAFNAQIRCGS